MATRRTDRLQRYRDKRDFSRTPEPRGAVASSKDRRYVVQKHAARRLHYDFRLALDGVLLSWAVTRGPSLDPAQKRLAVRTEDHPLAYGDFEGIIPSGYGAGAVLLWDAGGWEAVGDPHAGLARGALKFRLHGERLRGGFALIRMGQTDRRGHENWLLIKERDDYVDADDPLRRWTDSIATGRDLAAITAGEPSQAAPEPRTSLPHAVSRTGADDQGSAVRLGFIAPQLASLGATPPDGPGWLHEIKFDGYRIQALIADGAVRLITRNGRDWSARYGAIVSALARLDVRSAIIDGELIAFDAAGRVSFSALQHVPPDSTTLVYYAFDLLHLDGRGWRDQPLHQRKAALADLVSGAAPAVRLSDSLDAPATHVLETACRMGLEGVVSKRRDAPYRSGRGRLWIKTKCRGNDEFVIGGFRRSHVAGRAFASLLVGSYEGDQLVYRGRVGAGFDEATLAALGERFRGLRRAHPPFARLPAAARRDAVWLAPRLIAQIRYAERTPDGLLRQPSSLGLREDKAPGEVIMPTPPADAECLIRGVRLTHADKVMYPGQDITKRDLAAYYEAHAERILAFVRHRPLSLVRCPDGRTGQCFFQKHGGSGLPRQIGQVDIPEKDDTAQPCLLVRDAAGLVAAIQYGTLELHVWGARADRIERPERLVFDLDPAEDVNFATVRESAFELRAVLSSAGLTSFALLTGGKGIHVVVPITRRHEWVEVKTFARGLAEALAAAAPARYVAQAAKHKRGGRIFIDWLRNERGATAVAPYSTRARSGAPVATPVAWEELGSVSSAAEYTLVTIGARLDALTADPWEGYAGLRQGIPKGALAHLADGWRAESP